jgi:4,5-DOPA dioxygenase extradiol
VTASTPAPAGRMPVLFAGHGSPMNAIEDNRWSRALRELGARLPRPRAVLAVSAHWHVPGIFTTGGTRPETIHDFGGFPRALYEVRYAAPGDPDLARRAAALASGAPSIRGPASVSTGWGLDHGTWSVLVHLLPAADVPVVQLSLDARLAPPAHLGIGRALAPLRDEGVLILASGNLVHDLRHAFGALQRGETDTPGWARRFDAETARALESRDEPWLAGALDTADGRASHPTPDHFLPVLYAAGAAGPGDGVCFPVTGFDLGSLSMRSVLFG